MGFSLGCQARSQYQVAQKQDTEEAGCSEKNQHLSLQNSDIDTAIAQTAEPEPLSIDPLQHIHKNKQDQSRSQDYQHSESPAASRGWCCSLGSITFRKRALP